VNVSFDLAVLAMDANADAAAAGAMFEQCSSHAHRDGDLDDRVVRFYEHLYSVHPDCRPYPADSPWMSIPLSSGIDHVIMNLSNSPRNDAAIELIQQLAAQHGLVLWDPQSREACLPESSRSLHHG
jgi:hypothetical protein